MSSRKRHHKKAKEVDGVLERVIAKRQRHTNSDMPEDALMEEIVSRKLNIAFVVKELERNWKGTAKVCHSRPFVTSLIYMAEKYFTLKFPMKFPWSNSPG